MDVPEEDEEEKFNSGPAMKDRHGTLAGPPLPDQFEDEDGPDFSDEAISKGQETKAAGGRKTLTSQYKCNTGKMTMTILGSEQRGKGTNVHT